MIYNSRVIKEKNPLVSVIVTNYNYEFFVSEAIDSILSQTYSNIEILIIDDGSTDGSVPIIEKYAHSHENIKFISQKNKGVVYARNLGLEKSSGEFFVFIDADDTVPETFIQNMLSTMLSENADVVFCDLKLLDKMDGVIEIEAQSIEGFIHFIPTPICQLVRKSIVKNIRFDEKLNGLAHEDNDFFFGLFLNGAKFVKSDTHYNYRIHGNGRSPALNTQKHYKARLYILEKYKNSHKLLNNALIDTLIYKDAEIKKWHEVADERYHLIKEKDVEISKVNDEHNKRYSDLVNSFRYKAGSFVTLPFYGLKKILKNKRKK